MPRKKPTTLADRLKAARKAANLTLEALAEASGVARSTIHEAETGRDISVSKLRKLADALGVTLDELVPKN